MRLPTLAILLLMLSHQPARADFDAGMYAFSMGNYETAAREFRSGADQGDALSEYYMGLMHETGQGLPQDYAQALRWYTRAARKGEVDAAFALGRLYASGLGVDQDRARAYAWYARAARGGHYLGSQEQAKCARALAPEQLQVARQLDVQ